MTSVINESRTFTVENNVHKGEITTSKYKSIGEFIWNKIKSHGDNIAQLDACTDKTVTYAELQDKVIRCALWLQEQGIKPCDVVNVCTHNHLESIVPCLATIYITAIFNTWNVNLNLQSALHVMQLTTPKIIFCSEQSINIILSAMKKSNCKATVVIFGDHTDAISFSDILSKYSDAEVASFQYVECNDLKKTMCIVHSSGTTGMPKGVEVSNYSLLHISEDKNIDFTNAVSIWFSSLYWITGIIMNLMTIAKGAKAIIYPEFEEEMLCLLIEKYKITVVFLSTSMLSRFYRAGHLKRYSLSSLKIIIFGGAAIKPKIHEETRNVLSHVQILHTFGMSEIGGYGTLQRSDHKNGSSGTVVQDMQMKIVDLKNGNILGPNQLGELCLKTSTVMNGYYKNPEATKNTIDEQGWLHSGDIAYFDEDGEFYIVDRIKDLIKYRGHQISPVEIENILITHPAVLEVAVTAIPHETDDEHPIAFVIRMPDTEVTEQELIDLVSNNMMDQYKLRAGVIFLKAIPRTNTGKVAKRELKAMAKKMIERVN